MKYLKPIYHKYKALFLAFAISRFAPDYETTKAENKELKQDIFNLIRKENEVEGITVKIRWGISFKEDDITMFGDNTDSKLHGLHSRISID